MDLNTQTQKKFRVSNNGRSCTKTSSSVFPHELLAAADDSHSQQNAAAWCCSSQRKKWNSWAAQGANTFFVFQTVQKQFDHKSSLFSRSGIATLHTHFPPREREKKSEWIEIGRRRRQRVENEKHLDL
jgi:hypothetical protein